jgi:NAD(P)-dependent dehydrogenase (short-subunit alcohol dehydrogenase family)
MKAKTAKYRRGLSGITVVALTAFLIGMVPHAGAQSGADPAAEPETGTVLITGANRGIGLELARQYSAAGWQIIGTARRPDSADELRAIDAEVLQLDVTDQQSVDQLARDLADRPIDILINNAGIQPLMWKLADIDFGEFERALNVNTIGPVRVVQALLPNLRSGEFRKVVNVTTNLSSIADNTDGGFYGYRESKAALNMFTRSLAAELGPEGFICIVLHPGWVRTDLGGPDAPLNVTESVTGMRRVIESLVPADNGSFHTYAGEQMAW